MFLYDADDDDGAAAHSKWNEMIDIGFCAEMVEEVYWRKRRGKRRSGEQTKDTKNEN